jgi:alpha-amylase
VLCADSPCSLAPCVRIVCVQAFNWESHKKPWYRDCMGKVSEWAKQGITSIWLPPPSDSVSPQVRQADVFGLHGSGD